MLTMECPKSGINCRLSYPAFAEFRTDIAYLCGQKYGDCYNRMKEIYFHSKNDFFRLTDRLERLRISENVSEKMHHFLLMSDSDGELSNDACKELLFLVQKLPTEKRYGTGNISCSKTQIELVLLECISGDTALIWY